MNLDARFIQDHAPGWRVSVWEETPSTNDVAREMGAAGEPHGAAVFAEHQTAGRGRRQNKWHAPKGRDLMFSVLLRPGVPMPLWPRITTLAALAVCKGIESELPLKPAIKWPNDVYLGDRKLAGLLAESMAGSAGGFIVLGIGINVNAGGFPDDLRATATSLALELRAGPGPVSRNSLAAAILTALGRELTRIDTGFVDAMAEVRARSWLAGKTVRATVDGREVFGRVTDLNHEGHLVLAFPDGSSRALSSADDVRRVV